MSHMRKTISACSSIQIIVKMAANIEPGSLENAALERKKRLLAMRNRKSNQNGDSDGPAAKRATGDGDEKLPK